MVNYKQPSQSSKNNIFTGQHIHTEINLPEHKQQQFSSIKAQKQVKNYGFFSLFRFTNRTDIILIIFGIIFSLLTGATIPIFSLLWGNNIIDNFKSVDNLVEETYNSLIRFIYIGAIVWIFGWIMITCWTITGQRQVIKCKNKYLYCLLNQEIGWFQCSNQYQISSSFSVDMIAYQLAISHNISYIIYVLGMTISGLVISFSRGWLMTLVIIVSMPIIVFTKCMYKKFILSREQKQLDFYSQAGGRAQQALFSIKTVKILNGEKFQLEKYNQSLEKTKKQSSKFFLLFGISVGAASFFILSTFAFGLWYGSHCIRQTQFCSESAAKQTYTAGTVFTIFFSILSISFMLSHIPQKLKKVMLGLAAAQRIFRVIDREPRIKNPQKGIKLQNFKGVIRFNNVNFSYPKDPNKIVLNSLNLEINKKKIAFVGQSGCGKSTIIQLIMRFYDPNSGEITVDGINLRDIDLVWWRQEMIGYVGQEPVLFATTIKQNLLFSSENSTEQQLQQALRKAKILDFINSLEKKMETYVGSGGCQVSGGQKQRIAIARAIVRKPKMLILDEATSALDRKTQKQIQHTLNQISNDVMSITIAHRTKTIMNSDQIFVIENGKVKESGRFEQLQMFKNARVQLEKEDVAQKQIQLQQTKQESNNEIKQIKIQQTKKPKKLLNRLIPYYKQNYFYIFLAFIATAFIGGAFPLSTIFLANLTEEMLIPFNPKLENQANRNTLIVVLISAGQFFSCIIQIYLIQKVGQSISTKIRVSTFSKLLKLPINWHDKQQNNLTSITSKLSVGSYQIRQMTSTSVFAFLQILLCLITGLIIAFIYQWRLALIQIAFLPINFTTAAFTSSYRDGISQNSKQQLQKSGMINQAVINIKTVYSLAYQKKILKKYSVMLDKPIKNNIRRAIICGFFSGLGQCVLYILISVLYYIGALFVRDYDVPVKNVFTVIFAMFFATVSISEMTNLLPNIGKCIQSSRQIFQILDSKDEEQMQVQENSKMIKDTKIEGDISLRNIKFKYPSRSSYLFNDLNLRVEKGKKVGFVGYSGCGKSTIMSFLLRFYEPESGEILIDGINIKDYDIHFLRSQFGVVSQQPVVFNASFKQNIEYNMKVSDKQIIEAAKKANALEFISKNEEKTQQTETQYIISESIIESGVNLRRQMFIKLQKYEQQVNINNFNRVVGVKGGSISGGKKQRVAIARAILRKPEILLLDQATSALDSENEKKVIDCLDKIMENKTTISIAHKLETIKNSDLIYVFNRGIIIEQGTYDSLLEKKGYFYKLDKGLELL